MKAISEMSEWEKSELLARVCGWTYRHDQITGEWWNGDVHLYSEWVIGGKAGGGIEHSVVPLNLYHRANFELAWLVLNWADKSTSISQTDWHIFKKYADELLSMSLSRAASTWLDKILSLAIEAGMLEETAAQEDGS